MIEHIKKMIEDFEKECETPGKAKTPAADHLFKVNPECNKLNEKMKSDLHTHTAKGLFACKRGRPDMQTAMANLTTRETEPDEDDWKKSLQLMSHLKDTVELLLTLEADDLRLMRWLMDAACAVHHDMKHEGTHRSRFDNGKRISAQ